MRYILAPSSLAGRGLGVGFLCLITSGSAVSRGEDKIFLGMQDFIDRDFNVLQVNAFAKLKPAFIFLGFNDEFCSFLLIN